MNMEVDYMVHKSRIRKQLQEAAHTALSNQRRESETVKNRSNLAVTSIVKKLMNNMVKGGVFTLTCQYVNAFYAAIFRGTKQIQSPKLE